MGAFVAFVVVYLLAGVLITSLLFKQEEITYTTLIWGSIVWLPAFLCSFVQTVLQTRRG